MFKFGLLMSGGIQMKDVIVTASTAFDMTSVSFINMKKM